MNLKIKILLVLFCFFKHSTLFSQDIKETLPDNVFLYPDKDSQFIQTEDSLYLYLKKNYKICRNHEIKEQIVSRILIDEEGFTSSLKIISRNNFNYELILQDIFYSKKLWIPASVNHKNVKSFRFLSLMCENGELKLPPYY